MRNDLTVQWLARSDVRWKRGNLILRLPASILESAFDVLETCDLVVGPTHDGGYYLVGAKVSYPDLPVCRSKISMGWSVQPQLL